MKRKINLSTVHGHSQSTQQSTPHSHNPLRLSVNPLYSYMDYVSPLYSYMDYTPVCTVVRVLHRPRT